MGRTVPSFRMLLEEIIEDLSIFKRALRGEDKVAFDSLMNKARENASSCTVAPLLSLWNILLVLFCRFLRLSFVVHPYLYIIR
jgi:hypothetical protein